MCRGVERMQYLARFGGFMSRLTGWAVLIGRFGLMRNASIADAGVIVSDEGIA